MLWDDFKIPYSDQLAASDLALPYKWFTLTVKWLFLPWTRTSIKNWCRTGVLVTVADFCPVNLATDHSLVLLVSWTCISSVICIRYSAGTLNVAWFAMCPTDSSPTSNTSLCILHGMNISQSMNETVKLSHNCSILLGCFKACVKFAGWHLSLPYTKPLILLINWSFASTVTICSAALCYL